LRADSTKPIPQWLKYIQNAADKALKLNLKEL
jgi:hypothetical protein